MYQIHYKFSPSRRWNMILVSGFWQNWSFWVVWFVGKRTNLVLYRTRESGWFLVLCVLGLFKRRIPPLSSKPLLLNFAMALWPCYVDLDHIWRGWKIISWAWGPPIQQEPPNDLCQFYGWASHSKKSISFGVLKIGLLIAFWTQGMWIVVVFSFLTQIFYACWKIGHEHLVACTMVILGSHHFSKLWLITC